MNNQTIITLQNCNHIQSMIQTTVAALSVYSQNITLSTQTAMAQQIQTNGLQIGSIIAATNTLMPYIDLSGPAKQYALAAWQVAMTVMTSSVYFSLYSQILTQISTSSNVNSTIYLLNTISVKLTMFTSFLTNPSLDQ